MITKQPSRSLFKQLPHQHIFNLAWPMMIANISIPLTGLVDSAILGHLDSSNYMSAVAIGTSILAFCYWAFSFLRMGTTSETGRAYGAQNMSLVRQQLKLNLGLAFAIGLIITTSQIFTIPLALQLMGPELEVRHLSEAYLSIRFYGAPATLATYVVIGWFIGLQNTRAPLVITLTVNMINVLLDYTLIVIWEYHVYGAAVASIIAEYCGFLLSLLMAIPYLNKLNAHPDEPPPIPVWTRIKTLATMNSHLFVRTALLLFVFNFFTAQGAKLGADVLAANSLIIQLALFVSFALDGYAHAAEAMTAQAIGKKNIVEFWRVCIASTVTAFLIALVLSLILYSGGSIILSWLTDIPDVLSSAIQLIPWLTLIPIISIWCYLLDGIFIGTGQTRILRNTMVTAVLLVFLPLWFFTQPQANQGLWLSFVLFNGFRGLSLGFYFFHLNHHNKWISA